MATVVSQFIGMVWVVQHFRNKESFVHFRPGFWKMKRRIVASIFSIGMSPFAMNVTACVIVILINNSLQKYGGDMAIGAYGIMNRLLMLYVMIVMGLTMGMQPGGVTTKTGSCKTYAPPGYHRWCTDHK